MVSGAIVGTKYYYEKGHVRVRVKIARDDLVALKGLAIDKNKSVVALASDAISWFLGNMDTIPAEFPAPQLSSTDKPFYTYIDKDVHKDLKKVSIGLNRPLCDILGFILTVWSRADGEV